MQLSNKVDLVSVCSLHHAWLISKPCTMFHCAKHCLVTILFAKNFKYSHTFNTCALSTLMYLVIFCQILVSFKCVQSSESQQGT